MTKEQFINWLDTIIDISTVDWEIRDEFEDGTILVAFVNVEPEED